jgi:ubiquinone/menaquinone biosynthesis C-methylase UbiE
MVATDRYVLGHSEAELKRLSTQAQLIDPITRRFLVSAGIAAGMRVLDVDSGAGDVAVLLASLVGPGGEVIGTDPARTAIDVA